MAKEDKRKVINIGLFILAAISLFFAWSSKPNRETLDFNNTQLHIVSNRIRSQKRAYKENAPSAQRNSFNLAKAQKDCQQRVAKTVSFALGGATSKEEFEREKEKMNTILSTEVVEKLKSMNADGSEDALYNPNDLKFNIADKTEVNVTFKDIDNVHHAKVIALVTYQSKHSENKQLKHALINLDYDLTTQKANEGSITVFSSNFDN